MPLSFHGSDGVCALSSQGQILKVLCPFALLLHWKSHSEYNRFIPISRLLPTATVMTKGPLQMGIWVIHAVSLELASQGKGLQNSGGYQKSNFSLVFLQLPSLCTTSLCAPEEPFLHEGTCEGASPKSFTYLWLVSSAQ